MKAKSSGTLSGRRIVVGVTGSIAAFKAADVVSQLVQRGAQVHVVMTDAATKFVGPLTFQAIARTRVMTDQFDLENVIDATHVSLTDEADLVLIAPATANTIAKIAHGLADDMLTSLVLAVKCPLLIAPAMNDRMWTNRAVAANVAKAKELGAEIVEPGTGFLACGTYAVGRLAEPADIVAAVEKKLAKRA